MVIGQSLTPKITLYGLTTVKRRATRRFKVAKLRPPLKCVNITVNRKEIIYEV